MVVGILTVELGGELTATRLPRGPRLPDAAPRDGGLEERFLTLVLSLPADAQTLLLIAAADPTCDPALLRGAASRLGVVADPTDVPALDRLLTLTPRVAFRHALMRSVVYQGASPLARRHVHEALAGASNAAATQSHFLSEMPCCSSAYSPGGR
jgi:hypothetical protein